MNTHDKLELPSTDAVWAAIHLWNSGRGAYRVDTALEEYARAAIEPYKDEIDRLQRIIDSRPAINAGLLQTYIEWSHNIYQMEAAGVLEVNQ